MGPRSVDSVGLLRVRRTPFRGYHSLPPETGLRYTSAVESSPGRSGTLRNSSDVRTTIGVTDLGGSILRDVKTGCR